MLGRRGKTPLLLLIIVLLVVIGVVGTFAFMNKGSSVPRDHTVQEADKELVPLEEFVVNLADRRESRYLKVEIALELRGQNSKEETAKLKPKVRDAIIQVLSSKYYVDLLDQDGKEALKEEIKESLNKTFESSKVMGVFFTSFAMQ